jgi:cyclin-A
LRRPIADNFGKIQKDISPAMRAILVDWLVEVTDEFKLQADTLYLAVSYIDRFLTTDAITRDRLQLLGVTVTALLVAAYGTKLCFLLYGSLKATPLNSTFVMLQEI